MYSDNVFLGSLKAINTITDIQIGLKDITLMINKEIARLTSET